MLVPGSETPSFSALIFSSSQVLMSPLKIPARVYGVMGLTTILTYAALMTGYKLLFPPQSLFA